MSKNIFIIILSYIYLHSASNDFNNTINGYINFINKKLPITFHGVRIEKLKIDDNYLINSYTLLNKENDIMFDAKELKRMKLVNMNSMCFKESTYNTLKKINFAYIIYNKNMYLIGKYNISFEECTSLIIDKKFSD